MSDSSKATINFGDDGQNYLSSAVLGTTTATNNGDYALGDGIHRNNDHDNRDKEEEELSGYVSECVSSVNQIIQTTSEINNRIIEAADDSRIVVVDNQSESITFIQALETTRPSIKSSPVRQSASVAALNSVPEVNQKKKKQTCQSNSTFYIPVNEGSSSSSTSIGDSNN